MFNNQLLPIPFTPSNYIQIWQAAPVLEWTFNSLYIGILAAVLVTFSSALTAFAFTYFHFHFPGRNFLFGSAFYFWWTGQRHFVEGIVTQCGKG